jgi:mRNA-degrading endonuclease RelE of RelBE toxin-antitoxin system
MASSWTVEFTASARREFKLLSSPEKASASEFLLELAEDPFPFDAVPLRGYQGLYRVRVHQGRLRLIYHVSQKQRKIVITRLRPRGTAYIGFRT